MHTKRRPLPLEVSAWMEKDLTLRKITANSRLLTNDTRQNIVLSRQFFSNLLTLSFTRYRKMAEYDFDKRLFLKNQRSKAQSSMAGYEVALDQVSATGSYRASSGKMPFGSKSGSPLICPSAQSFLSRSETKSDPTFNRNKQPSPRQVNTVQPITQETEGAPISISPPPIVDSPLPVIASTTTFIGSKSPVMVSTTPVIGGTTSANPRSTSRLKSSRERLDRLSQPRGFRPKSTHAHVRAHLISDKKPTTAEDLFGKIENGSEVEAVTIEPILPDKPKSALDDHRFRQLVDTFCQVHDAQKSNVQTVKNIIQANPSLQDKEGQWKAGNLSVINRKAELDRARQLLVEKLNSRIDVFLIDVGA